MLSCLGFIATYTLLCILKNYTKILTNYSFFNKGGKTNFLTPAEHLLMVRRADGLSMRKIAENPELSFSGKSNSRETPKTHASSVYKKITAVHLNTYGMLVPNYTLERWGVQVHMGTGFALYFLALTAILEINAYKDVGQSDIVETIQSVNKQFDAIK